MYHTSWENPLRRFFRRGHRPPPPDNDVIRREPTAQQQPSSRRCLYVVPCCCWRAPRDVLVISSSSSSSLALPRGKRRRVRAARGQGIATVFPGPPGGLRDAASPRRERGSIGERNRPLHGKCACSQDLFGLHPFLAFFSVCSQLYCLVCASITFSFFASSVLTNYSPLICVI